MAKKSKMIEKSFDCYFFDQLDPRIKQNFADQTLLRRDRSSFANAPQESVAKIFDPNKFSDHLGGKDY